MINLLKIFILEVQLHLEKENIHIKVVVMMLMQKIIIQKYINLFVIMVVLKIGL